MKIDNSIAQMRKGVLEFCVLGIISKKEIYASDILVELKNCNLIIVEGTLYPILTRLKNTEMVEYKWAESQFGPPRKYYTITPLGTQSLASLKQSWEELYQSVNKAIII